MRKYCIAISIFISSCLVGCGDKSTTNTPVPSGLTAEQQNRFKKLPSEGKEFVEQKMREYDRRAETANPDTNVMTRHEEALKIALSVPPDGGFSRYIDKSASPIEKTESENILKVLANVANSFQESIPSIQKQQDKWESELEYKKRIQKHISTTFRLSTPLDPSIKDTLLAIRFDGVNKSGGICSDINYDVDKKTISFKVFECMSNVLFKPYLIDDKFKTNIFPFVACCIERAYALAIQNNDPSIGRGLKLKNSDYYGSTRDKLEGALISIDFPLTIDNAKKLLPDKTFRSILAMSGFGFVLVGKVAEKVTGPIPPNTIPFSLSKILVINSQSGEVLFDRTFK